ncbi:ABC transporter permease subunit [Chthonobacter albigriseus]|uniref:ABC transporter permease subunit n=1 Tax=Chthonobacter albigriseus TaxID=1683161 RepID=UPI0015EF466A
MLEILVSGLSQGAVYCVFALGLSLVYGTSRILNFAHGSMYMTAAYLAWLLTAGWLTLPVGVALLVLVPVLFLFGVGVERLVIRPLRPHANWKTATMMATLGFAFVLDNLNLVLFGPTSITLAPLVEGTLALGPVVISRQSAVTLVLAVLVVAALQVFLTHSAFGRAMRAVSQDMTGAEMVGIRVGRVYAASFGISAVLAGVAAVLLSPVYLISPLGGWAPFLKAFVIVVFGGLGSTQGVLYAAFILGLVEAVVVAELSASWTMPIWFLVLLTVLMVRPRGLLGSWGD